MFVASTIVTAAQQADLDEHANAIRAYARSTVHDIIEIGRHLAEAKKMAGHGNFLSWIEREFAWSEDTAERFIAVHALQRQIPHVAELSLPLSGLYRLAAPSTPKQAVEEVVARAEAGERMSVVEIKSTIAQAKPAKKSRGVKKPPAAAEVESDAALAARLGVSQDEVERDRKECVALYQKACAAERELAQWRADHPAEDDAAASAEQRKAQYADEPDDSITEPSTPKAVTAKDIALREFDGHVLRLAQMTNKAKAARFAKTGARATTLRALADFLGKVATEAARQHGVGVSTDELETAAALVVPSVAS